MPHVGPVREGRTFFCAHCGALYLTTPSLVPKNEGDAATCVVCNKAMHSSSATNTGTFKLIHRPEDA
jgi:transcription elongation factor Elf1